MTASKKANVLLFGGGAVGTIGAVNLEAGGLAEVTIVLRSNFKAVNENGYLIESCDHGDLKGWKPTKVINGVPDVAAESLLPYDYIFVCSKNCSDIPPSIATIIAPAVTPSHTVIVLNQNGLNIEKPIQAAFPSNICLSGISLIDAHEKDPGHIRHEYADDLLIGAFHNPNLKLEDEEKAAKNFVELYGAAGKTQVAFVDDVPFRRWRKLVYNASWNPICAILETDTGTLKTAAGVNIVEGLVKPVMWEIIAAAKAHGYDLPDDVVDFFINIDPPELKLKPSMQVDKEKGNFLEFENLVGEPLRAGTAKGVDMPKLAIIYELCKLLQWKTKAAKGLIEG
ncbi:MAG: hypothetical protein M1834_002980 [Cirrosporium novae-zelandiae]|nr:MAG: hypothetical protein M1834_002980 [Cirrosporium novae-zelandiae]